MPNITIIMKDGEIKYFPHTGRAGGSYTKQIKYDGGFAIVTDEYGIQKAYPQCDIKEIEVEPHYRGV